MFNIIEILFFISRYWRLLVLLFFYLQIQGSWEMRDFWVHIILGIRTYSLILLIPWYMLLFRMILRFILVSACYCFSTWLTLFTINHFGNSHLAESPRSSECHFLSGVGVTWLSCLPWWAAPCHQHWYCSGNIPPIFFKINFLLLLCNKVSDQIESVLAGWRYMHLLITNPVKFDTLLTWSAYNEFWERDCSIFFKLKL